MHHLQRRNEYHEEFSSLLQLKSGARNKTYDETLFRNVQADIQSKDGGRL